MTVYGNLCDIACQLQQSEVQSFLDRLKYEQAVGLTPDPQVGASSGRTTGGGLDAMRSQPSPSTQGEKSWKDTLTAPWGGWKDFKYDAKCFFSIGFASGCQWPGDGSLGSKFAGLPPVFAAPEGMVFQTAHYASRLEAAGVGLVRAETEVANAIGTMRPYMSVGAPVWGRMTIDGVLVEYRVMMLSNGTVNIGTIFPVIP